MEGNKRIKVWFGQFRIWLGARLYFLAVRIQEGVEDCANRFNGPEGELSTEA